MPQVRKDRLDLHPVFDARDDLQYTATYLAGLEADVKHPPNSLAG